MLSEKADKIFKMKYAIHNDESWEDACARVSLHVSDGDTELMAKFYQLIYNLIFLPGGRIIANSGTKTKNLMNCFVLPVDDSRGGIYNTLGNAAEIFAWGGGVGYDFSNVREEGALVRTTGGKASGPLSFMSMFDQTGEVISQASRRGAQMGILNVRHPDIIKFIGFKSDLNKRNDRLLKEFKRNYKNDPEVEKQTAIYNDPLYDQTINVLRKTLADDQLTHFNISVSATDDFMHAVVYDKLWYTRGVIDFRNKNEIYAREILGYMAETAWESGDPGIYFYNRANDDNMVPYLGDLKTTNPCGEVPLLDYEPCCLGSINLHALYNRELNKIDVELLEYVVRTAIRFLDNVQTISETPLEEVNKWSKGLRRIGLGVMGWADVLAEMEIPYDSSEAIELARFLSWFISYFGWLESIEIAEEKGAFPFYEPKRVDLNVVEKILNSDMHEGKHDIEVIRNSGVRNVSITSIAPTGTIALIAGVNSSIEPFFALEYKRNITEGVGNTAKDIIIERNPILQNKLEKYEVDSLEDLPENVRDSFKTSHEIDWKWHVDHQAAWQEFTTNAVSKTINLPNSATSKDIFDAYIYMWDKGLKGGTIYRDGSKSFQILNTK